jgi:OOP family OmpA-OmpF porin
MRNALFIILLLLAGDTTAQNLIPNPSFESINYCETNIPCSPSAWYSVTNIPYGYQNDLPKAFDKKHSLAFLIAFEKEIRFYWQTMLLCSLQDGEKYNLDFVVYSRNIKFDPQYFGAHFSDTLFRSTKDTLIKIDKAENIHVENIQPLKNAWYKVKLSFIATGKEKYLLIGNFNHLSNKEILAKTSSHPKFIEYYIDEVSLKANNKSIHKCDTYKFRNDSLFSANRRHQIIMSTKPTKSLDKTYSSKALLKKDTITLGTINFNFDSDELINDEALKKYFQNVELSGVTKIEVRGFTDSIGSKLYNLNLSERRALSVKKYLIGVLKMPESLISTIGKGVTNDDPDVEKNRKVEIIINKTEHNN